MWIDQRDRDTKSGWVWGSIAVHAAIIAFFVMTPAQDFSETSAAPKKGSEAVTMSINEGSGTSEAPVVEPVKEDVKEKPVVVAKAKTKPKAKKSKKITPVVTALPKKEVIKETPDTKLPAQAVVIPNIPSEEEVDKLADAETESEGLDTSAAAIPVAAAGAVPGTPDGLANSSGVDKAAQNAGNEQGSVNNPRSYLQLKQKPGNIPPTYPEAARLQGEQGRTQLRYYVDENGKISDLQVMKSSGSALLDNAAVNAISKYQYLPGQSGWTTHPVNFTLVGQQVQTPGRLRTAGQP